MLTSAAIKTSLLVVLCGTISLPVAGQSSEFLEAGVSLAQAALYQGQADGSRGAGEAATSSLDARDRIYYPGDTERLKPLMQKLSRNVLLDQKDIWTSPFHMHKTDARWWIGFGALTTALIATDRQTSTVLENSKGQVAWGNGVSRIGAAYTLIPLVAGFYGFGVLHNDSGAREAGVLGAETLLDSLIVVSVLKPIAGRNRPDSVYEKGSFFDGGSSMPSGHAIETWSLASLLAHEYSSSKIVPIVAYSLASVVTAARFTAQKHFASDLVVGGAMGWFIGRYVWKSHEYHAAHVHGLKARFIPRIQPASGTYSVGVLLSK